MPEKTDEIIDEKNVLEKAGEKEEIKEVKKKGKKAKRKTARFKSKEEKKSDMGEEKKEIMDVKAVDVKETKAVDVKETKDVDVKETKGEGPYNPHEEGMDERDNIENEMVVTETEMLKMDLHMTRVQLQTQIREKFNLATQLLAVKYQEERSVLKAKMMGCDNSRAEARDDYNAIIRGVEQRFKINMSEYVVADNGVLTHEQDVG